jgi:hypothetical protein
MSAARLNKRGNVKERPSPNCFRNVRVRPLNMGAFPFLCSLVKQNHAENHPLQDLPSIIDSSSKAATC